MVLAYVLIQTEVGKAASVAEEARKIPGVEAADDVTGPYDVVVKASAEDVDAYIRSVAESRSMDVEEVRKDLEKNNASLRVAFSDADSPGGIHSSSPSQSGISR